MTNMALFAEQQVRADLARLLLAAVEASGRARCDIARDAQTGKSLGRGIVRFDDADSAARAVQFGNGSIFMGRDLNVREDRMMAQQQLQVQPPLPPMQPGGLPPQAVAAGAGDA